MDKRRQEGQIHSVEPRRRTCPNCQAEVLVGHGERAAVCEACGHRFELLRLAEGGGASRPQNPIDASVQPLVPFALAGLGIIVLAILASFFLIFINRATARKAADRWARRQTHVAPAIPPPVFERPGMVWYEPEPAMPVRLGPGRRPGVAGLFAREDGRVGRVWLGAFGVRSLRPVWQVGPLGDTSESTFYLHAAVQGDAVLVTDARGVLRVIDAATGAPRYALPLRGRAAALCAGPEGQAWVGFHAGPGVLVEVAKGRAVPAPRPAWCAGPPLPGAPRECRDLARRVHLHARCLAAASAPPLKGFVPEWVLGQGRQTVAVGSDTGPPLRPALAVFRGKRLLWRAELPGTPEGLGKRFPLLTDVIGNTLYVKAEWHLPPFHPRLMAYDLRSGSLRWSTELPREEHVPPPGLTAALSRVFVVTAGQLEMLDARDGKLLGIVGK